MSNVLSEELKLQMVALGRLGWSLRRIQRETGVPRETIAGYLRQAGMELRPPGGRQLPAKPASRAEEVTPDPALAKPASLSEPVTPDCGAPRAEENANRRVLPPTRSPSASACEAYRDAIEVGLAPGRNAKAIWQDLVDVCGFAGGYQSVPRFLRKLRGKQSPEACAVIETAPGEESQVDYGSGPLVRDPRSGKYRRTRLFVLTRGYRRKSVRLLAFQSSAQIWAELHEKAFRRRGGVTRTLILDNRREGVRAPDIYDPTINPLYRDLLQHYGTVALPCRIGDPDRKGKVERAVGYAKNTPLKGLRFENLEEAQAYLDHWEQHPHSWHPQASGGYHVRRAAAGSVAAAAGAFPLLPVRRTHGRSGRLRGSGGGVLWRAAGLDWTPSSGAVGCPLGAAAAPPDRRTIARTPASDPRPPPHPRGRSPSPNAARHPATADAGRSHRIPDRSALPCHAAQGWRHQRTPHSGRVVADQKVRHRQRGGRLRGRPGSGHLRVPFCAPLSGAPPPSAPELAANRSPHSPAHAIPRLHRKQTKESEA